MKVYLFRHGQTDWNIPHRMQGCTDIPLNENGFNQARTVAQKISDIRFDAAFSSTLDRAVTTAQILLGENQTELQTDDRLQEISFGIYEGDYFENVLEHDAHPLHKFITAPDQFVPPEKAESIDDVWRRVKSFFDEVLIPLEKKLSAELDHEPNVLIVSHGATIRVVTCTLAGRPYKQFWGQKHMSNLALNLIEVKDGEVTLIEEAKDML